MALQPPLPYPVRVVDFDGDKEVKEFKELKE